jgi:hypothetical protein
MLRLSHFVIQPIDEANGLNAKQLQRVLSRHLAVAYLFLPNLGFAD